jgi:hypothetical protein
LRAKIIAVALALSVALAVVAAQPAPGKSTSSGKTKKKTTAKKATTTKSTKAKGKTTAASKGKSKQAPRRSTQTQPSVDRYKEIQQALSDKGYFTGPVNGAWGSDSVDALKRFQRDQNIGDDGKLGSLSLMALGLGPKRDTGRGAVPEKQP